jgi:NAD(P)-dependent dehydrogenase (short-subunit alcohol dehydrogenase family)
MEDLPPIDDDLVEEALQKQREAKAAKQKRIERGYQSSGSDGESDGGQGQSGEKVSGEKVADELRQLTLEQREQRWGFTLEELRTTSKVISRLFNNPDLFAGDVDLTESKLHLFITRPKDTKRKNHHVYRQVVREEVQRRREADVQAVNSTLMKKERDDAVRRILQLTSKPEFPEVVPETGKSGNDEEPAAEKAEPQTSPLSSEPSTWLNKSMMCYTCKAKYRELHHYYYALCKPCGDFNWMKRHQKRDLTGKVVLLTGCRIKIGYEMALSLLRCGAILVGTTRFACDAVSRFAQEPDYETWKDRLKLYSLDLRDLWMVEQFCDFIKQHYPTLFAIINNAAQTIGRLPSYTTRLREQEVHPTPAQRQHLEGEPEMKDWRQYFVSNSSVRVGIAAQHQLEAAKVLQQLRMVMDVGKGKAEETAESRVEEVKPVAAVDEQRTSTAAVTKYPTTGTTETERLASAAQQLLGISSSSATAETALQLHGESRLEDVFAVSAVAPPPASTASPLTALTAAYDRYDTLFEASDTRTVNSWTMNMGQVEGTEAAEVMAINALAPFILNARLRPCLCRRDKPEERQENRFIINVSAMEGQFFRFKLTTHPHTNMAKAALNMMTRTSGADYAKDRIYMNAVDTGWITDETPLPKKTFRAEKFMLCPLDEVDAAARCLDLIYTDSTEHSQFWKDYHPTLW